MFSTYVKNRACLSCCLLLLFAFAPAINAGVSTDTLVVTPEGLKEISALKAGDVIVCVSKTLLPKSNIVTAVQDLELKSAIDVVTEDGVVIRVSPEQLFFVANAWVRADQLAVGDGLLKQDRTLIAVKEIKHQQGPVTMRFISVKLHHNFLVSQNGVLVHNGLGGATFGVYAGKFLVHFVAHGAILVAAAMTGPAAPATALALEATFITTIEAASNVGAIVGGIVAGTATGPV